MNVRAKTSVFLMELLIAITVFALCAAVCTWIFVDAFFMANDAKNINNALIVAKSGAETLKAYHNPEETLAALSGGIGFDNDAIYYDSDWRVCEQHRAAYILRISDGGTTPYSYELSVKTIAGEEIIAFPVTGGRAQ